jgi:hypothetical protein
MFNLEDTIYAVVQNFIYHGELFTALDVSNKVKETMPQERHRTIRDVVRVMYIDHIASVGWASTPITVTLANGDQKEALLYHPLSDAFDLDNKYDAQKRAQVATIPVDIMTSLPVGNPAGIINFGNPTKARNFVKNLSDDKSVTTTAPTHWNDLTLPTIPHKPTVGGITYSPIAPAGTPGNLVSASVPVTLMPTARTLWDNLFQKQPSLFPKK